MAPIQIYVRTSTKRQIESLELQMRECKRYAETTYPGCETTVTIEQCSAWSKARQEPPLLKNKLQQMKRTSNTREQVLIVYAVDRFARDSIRAVRMVKSFTRNGGHIHFVRENLYLNNNSPAHDYERFIELAVFAEQESNMLSDRIRAHHRGRAMVRELRNNLENMDIDNN